MLNGAGMNAGEILNLLVEDEKVEVKRHGHLESLVPVKWLAIPTNFWPSRSSWVLEKNTVVCEGIHIAFDNKSLTIAFDENHGFSCQIDNSLDPSHSITTLLKKIKDSKLLERERQNYMLKAYPGIANYYLVTKTSEWVDRGFHGWTLKRHGNLFELSFPDLCICTIGIDFISIKFGIRREDYAGRLLTPHSIRVILFKPLCVSFQEGMALGRNDFPDSDLKPILTNSTFECGKNCPAIEFVDKENPTEPEEIKGRSRCAWKINIPYVYNQKARQKHWTVLWAAPMGSGKSHALRELLKRHLDWKVLVISVRIALTKSFMDDFKSDGVQDFVSYQDVNGVLRNNKLICQIDSLHRVERNKDWDLIILDESESLMAHFNAETFEKSSYIFTIFRRLVSKAKRVVACDADLSKYNNFRTKWFIEGICKRKPTYIKSVAENDYRRYIRLTPSDSLAYRIVKLVESGKKVVVVSNTKTFPKKIHRLLCDRFKEKQGLAIYSEAGHAWNDCYNGRPIDKSKQSTDFDNLDWLAFSPVVSPGVSFDTNQFDVVCAMATPMEHAAGVRYFAQLCNRVREIGDGIVFYDIPLSVPNNYKSTKWTDIRDELNDSNKMQRDFMNDYRDVLMTDGMAEGEDEDIDYFAPMQMAEKAYNTLWCKNELESRRSVSHFERQFRHAKEIDGGTFYYLNQNNNEQEEKNAINQLMSKAKRDNLSDEYKDIIDAAIIDYEQYTKIKGNYAQTVQESYQLKRFEFCHFNGLNPEDKKLMEHLVQLKPYNAYKEDHFIKLLLPLKDLQARDKDMLTSRNSRGEENRNKSGKIKSYAKVGKKLESVKTEYFHRILNVLGMNNILDMAYYDSETTKVDLREVGQIIEVIKKDPDARNRFRLGTLNNMNEEKKCWKFLATALNLISKDMGLGNKVMVGIGIKRKWSLSHTYAKKKWQINPVYIQKLKYVLLKLKVKNRFWWGEHIDETIQTQIVQLLNEETVETMDNTINAPRLKRELSTNNTEQQPKKNKIEGSSNNNAINLTSNNNAINLTHNNNVINLT